MIKFLSRGAGVRRILGLVFLAGVAAAVVPSVARAQTDNQDCTLILPDNPLSAQGLATPFRLKATDPAQGPCSQLNTVDQTTFVQATIYDTVMHKLYVYNPLVIDDGTTPAAAPVVPALPPTSIVAIWVGSNGATIRLQGAGATTLANANCINGLNGDPFGQVSACNAPAFFSAALADMKSGALVAPPLGTAADGKACPTVRDFMVVDQDQSDNVTGTYLLFNGRVMQNTAANLALYPTATVLKNGSDNGLLTRLIDKAMACTPWTAPDLANGGTPTTSQALNELSAAAWQKSPIALVPMGDPMVLHNNQYSYLKTNLYRSIVGQPAIGAQGGSGSTMDYCSTIKSVGVPRIFANKARLAALPPADPAVGTNLFTFLCGRMAGTWENLQCFTRYRISFPLNVTFDANGVATDCSLAATTRGR